MLPALLVTNQHRELIALTHTMRKLPIAPKVRAGPVWSKRAGTVYLREYTADKCLIVKKLDLGQAEALLSHTGSKFETEACFNTIRVEKLSFWFQLSNSLNIRDGLSKAVDKNKLQAAFKVQCLQPLVDGETKQLEALFARWLSMFTKIVKKDKKLNDYDLKDTINLFKAGSGKSWQSPLLENSRRDGKVCFIETEDKLTDFSFAAMELTLSISAKNNPIFPQTESRIAPDGLGVRRDGFLTVFEVKGPSDERDLLGPLLQAICGALAVIAAKDNLCQILHNSTGRRPGYPKAKVPKKESIGIHILTAKDKRGGKLESWSQTHETLCERVLQAFPQLQYIAYSFVVPTETDNFKKLIVDHKITRH